MSMKTTTGFTLMELMITLAISAILASIAIASYQYLIQNTRAGTVSNDFSTAVMYAKVTSLSNHQRISICPATDSSLNTCSTSQTSWTNGWIIFNDVNNNGTIASSDNILRVQQAPDSSVTFSTSQPLITFGRSGTVVNGVGIYQIAATNCTGNNKTQIQLFSTGQVYMTSIACP